ncbi:Alpha/Beta hydrolase protein [Trichophaea hybrida]|nr:Alpha/Beta hydrolase protein [Trichophaea hybrida]
MLLRLVTSFLSVVPLLATCFTPEDLLSAPRQSPALSNKAGTLAIYSHSTYSFKTHSRSSSWTLLNLTSGESSELFPQSNIKAALWLGTDNETILFTNGTSGDGDTDFWVVPHLNETEGYKAITISGPVSDLKIHAKDDTIHFLFSSLSNPNGSLYNPRKAHKPHASGRVYESLFVRHWDTYIKPEKSSIFAGTLSLKYNLYASETEPRNLLPPKSGLETPVQPFGGAEDFDISPDGKLVAFVSKTPMLNPANNTQSLIYIVPFDGSKPPYALNNPDGKHCPPARGASSAPKFSPDDKSIGYLQMSENGYESDINKLYIAYLGEPSITEIAPSWDVSPQNIQWSPDSRSIYTTADNVGRHKLFKITIDSGYVVEVWDQNSVHALELLPDEKLLLSLSSLTSSLRSYVFNPSDKSLTALQPRPDQEKGLSQSQVEDFWFPGAEGVQVHGFIVKPSFFKKSETRKYKMAFFIHGGPQGAWNDGWSTRWNPTLFAEHGYIVVAVNPTGSTGYGQKFVNAIKGQWGGKPYNDLVNAFEYLEANSQYNYIDLNNAVALGASYGGYMINYIQGMPLGRKFKALVCHDGVFSTLNQYSSEELYFPQHDFEGTLWSNRAGYEKWDPARLVGNWATPQMIIHGELDYRLPVSEGLAAFNVLQEKGVSSKFLHFPDENHWVLNPENSLLWHTEVLEWIDRWTKADSSASTQAAQQPFQEL